MCIFFCLGGVCLCVLIHACGVCVVSVCVRVYMPECMCLPVFAFVYVFVCVSMYVCTHIRLNTRMHACIHACMYS